VPKKCKHCDSVAFDGLTDETIQVSNCPHCEFHEGGLIEHRIFRWTEQSQEEEEEEYTELICEAMEELTEMRAKIERLESENGRIRIRLREYAELESYRKDIGRL
jgi:molecular chaperone GrpE (heat shock protein)